MDAPMSKFPYIHNNKLRVDCSLFIGSRESHLPEFEALVSVPCRKQIREFCKLDDKVSPDPYCCFLSLLW